MAFQHEAYAFPMSNQQPSTMFYSSHAQYQPFMANSAHSDMVYQTYPYSEYADFLPPGMLYEEFDDGGEVTTRPRLTKDQVEVLEAQFQAHPKPNSAVKRQLAMQTKLSLPRVANWFQNRRAKAKQQRKQEEFENTQSTANGEQSESGKDSVMDDEPETDSDKPASEEPDQTATEEPPASREAVPSMKGSSPSKGMAWLSMQRTLAASKAVQRHAPTEQPARQSPQAAQVMPPPSMPRPSQSKNASLPNAEQSSLSNFDWAGKHETVKSWSSSPVTNDMGFDFGFDQELVPSTHEATSETSPTSTSQASYVVSPDAWDSLAVTPTIHNHPCNQRSEYNGLVHSPPLPIPHYPVPRRDSAAEVLAANFETFALAGTPPLQTAQMPAAPPAQQAEGQIDIAGRRKRPRPAALTSASLRSRSYGAMSSASPTFRQAMTPPTAQTIRHVKSTGHSLNNHYAGIRKSSLAQKSPLNISNFAEAESLKKLMAQNAVVANMRQQVSSTKTDMPNEHLVYRHGQFGSGQGAMADRSEHYPSVHSPPVTPFQPEFIYSNNSSLMPTSAVQAQFASLADYTPPYSAGPLTNSSWSDAPLTSPDMPTFPSVNYIQNLSFPPQADGGVGLYQPWVLPSEESSDGTFHGAADQKKTEFYIQEFPGQKEELANVAQQLVQSKPKHYVFANSKPSDYDGA